MLRPLDEGERPPKITGQAEVYYTASITLGRHEVAMNIVFPSPTPGSASLVIQTKPGAALVTVVDNLQGGPGKVENSTPLPRGHVHPGGAR